MELHVIIFILIIMLLERTKTFALDTRELEHTQEEIWKGVSKDQATMMVLMFSNFLLLAHILERPFWLQLIILFVVLTGCRWYTKDYRRDTVILILCRIRGSSPTLYQTKSFKVSGFNISALNLLPIFISGLL